MIILYEMLCVNFEIDKGVNVKQCNYLYNDDNMFVQQHMVHFIHIK